MSMRIAGWLTERQIAGCLLLFLAAPTAKAAATPWQEAARAKLAQSADFNGGQEVGPDSGTGKPVVDSQHPDATLPDAPEVAQSPSNGSNEPNGTPQPGQGQQQNGAAQPVGTAAAPAVRGKGVAGSQVSGAAIAPAKQRQVRTFLIRIAVVVAAGAAVGTVVALTHATPSQPR
ncbi:MAG: hypothetical protein ABSB60_13425 [Terracidiphilus sp.]|jgi:hypothetical protein